MKQVEGDVENFRQRKRLDPKRKIDVFTFGSQPPFFRLLDKNDYLYDHDTVVPGYGTVDRVRLPSHGVGACVDRTVDVASVFTL